MGRIVDYPEITTLSAGDYLIVDNAESGTKKVSAQSVAGTVDSTPTESSTNAVSSGGVWTSLNDISEEFDGLRTDVYDVYPKGIASGDIVQFETGADNVPLSDLTGYIYPMMSGSGMPSRTNIRTISGPDDINIYQRSKNLIEQITYQSEPETVYLGVQNSSNLTMFFKAGDYRITVNIVGGSTVVPYWSVGSTATHSEHMHLDNDTNVSIYVYDADGISASDIESFQVEVGTEATDYVEFEGDITNVVLPTDRGTIYSGRVALAAGKVYIDTVIYERNSSTMNNTEDKPGWAYTGLQTYDVAIGTFDDVIYWPNGDVRCTNVNVGSTYSVEVANEDYRLILPRDVYNMSQSQWISAGVDIQILVKLNTPIEIDIDPVEVRSLYGFNTYYCNSGKTYVFYSMDLAKYISDKTTEVQKEERAKLEKAFVTDTASGNVATFEDGADDIPMKSVKVAIEPVQDLHGQEAPYPAGGGKNKFDSYMANWKKWQLNNNVFKIRPDTDAGVTFTPNEDGTVTVVTTGTYMGIAVEIESSDADRVFSVSGATRVALYSAYEDGASQLNVSPTYATISAGVSGCIGIRFDAVGTYTIKCQLEEGSTATDYAPYSNICPITSLAGENIWDEEWEAGNINLNGQPTSTDNTIRSKNFCRCMPNTTYYCTCGKTDGGNQNRYYIAIFWYDENENFLSYNWCNNLSVTSPSNAQYFKICTNTSTVVYGNTYNNDIAIKYPASSTCYVPYSGKGGATVHVTRAGKNLFDPNQNFTLIACYDKDGQSVYRKGTELHLPDGTYAFSASKIDTEVGYIYINVLNADGSFVRFWYFIASSDIRSFVTTLEDGQYIIIYDSLAKAESDETHFYEFNIQIEKGSTTTDYEPYTGNTYSITFPTEAGTVYGGILDVTNGVLTVDRAMVDLGDYEWTRNTDWGRAPVFKATLSDSKRVNTTEVPASKCSIYKTVSAGDLWIGTNDKACCINLSSATNPNTPIYVRVQDSSYSDAATFKTAMDGVQFCYELAEPITYNLTPTEIKSLLGDNNVWADAGDTEVTYRADTKLYIDKKIAEVINALS